MMRSLIIDDEPKNIRILKNLLTQFCPQVQICGEAESAAAAIELINEQKNVVHTDIVKKSGLLTYKDILVGKYQIRVTYDTNNNGKWDSGNIRQKLYPEQIIFIPKTFQIRANFEAKETLDIPKEVVTQ